jgi:hypothetical protein
MSLRIRPVYKSDRLYEWALTAILLPLNAIGVAVILYWIVCAIRGPL